VRSIIAGYEVPVTPSGPAERARLELQKPLASWASRYLHDIAPTGSYVKGTRIRGSTDLDLLVSLNAQTRGTMKQVFHSLFSALKGRGYSAIMQKVSIGVVYGGVGVDIIPAKRSGDNSSDHHVYRTERDVTVKTNIYAHTNLIQGCGRVEEIKAAKIWRDLRGLEFPSFCLELVVLDALRHRAMNQPAANLRAVLEYLRDRFVGAPFRDPQNFSNIVSDAAVTLKHPEWEKVLW
jgi:hypothetical protein